VVGTAVDANVLIFERVKEELRGAHLGCRSIDTGDSSLAFSSITRWPLHHLISCAALFGRHRPAVKGFMPVTLAIRPNPSV